MKFNTRKIMSAILALNLMLSTVAFGNIDSFAITIDENDRSDKWESVPKISTGRRDIGTVVVDGKIYCIGGGGAGFHNKVDVYDPITNTWETKTPKPTGSYGFAIGVIDGKIYCVGGHNGRYLDIVEVYDPATDTWETKEPMSSTKFFWQTCQIGDKIYGLNGNIIEVYDYKTNTWEVKTTIPNGRSHCTLSVIGDKIYCIGGSKGSTYYLQTVEVYDTKTDTWEVKASLPSIRSYHTAPVLNGKIYCIGGYIKDSNNGGTVEMYDPETDTWERKANMPTSRNFPSSAVLNGRIYCIGGNTSSYKYLDTVEAYIPNAFEYNVEQIIASAERSKSVEDIANARSAINALSETELKRSLQARLDAISPDIEFKTKEVSANVDVYIKCDNMLTLSLDNNAIVFEDYSGAEPVEKINAINLTVKSSLPYNLNAYMPTEISNADGSSKMELNLFNIKESSETVYKQFENHTDKIVLKENCLQGNNIEHSIDLKLDSSDAYVADIYKTVIRFEAEQK